MPTSDVLAAAHLRIARPTDRLPAVVDFYTRLLDFSVLGQFQDHDGFDAVMLGHAGAGYHLEFTIQTGHAVGDAPTRDHLLVFYIPDVEAWRKMTSRIERNGIPSVPSWNPYWDRHGKRYEDPDGYRVVLQNGTWPR